MKNILIPTDFSCCADKALDYALKISKGTKCQLIIMHACDLMDYPFQDTGKQLARAHNEELKEELYRQLSQERAKVLESGNYNVITTLYDGSTTDSILQAAKDYKADLILMGTMGARGWKAKLTGSKATAVLRHSTIPVLVVPPDFKGKAPDKILIAIKDGNDGPEVLKPVFDLAAICSARLSVVIFSDEAEEGYEILADTRTIYKIRVKLMRTYPGAAIELVHLSGEDFTSTLEKYMAEKEFDLLAMITHHKEWIHNLTGKSFTQKMAQISKVPVLSLTPIKER